MNQQPKPKLTVLSDNAAATTLRKEIEELKAMGLVRELPGEHFELTDAGRIALHAEELSRVEELVDAAATDLAVLLEDLRR